MIIQIVIQIDGSDDYGNIKNRTLFLAFFIIIAYNFESNKSLQSEPRAFIKLYSMEIKQEQEDDYAACNNR